MRIMGASNDDTIPPFDGTTQAYYEAWVDENPQAKDKSKNAFLTDMDERYGPDAPNGTGTGTGTLYDNVTDIQKQVILAVDTLKERGIPATDETVTAYLLGLEIAHTKLTQQRGDQYGR